jgi:hypothetical protein
LSQPNVTSASPVSICERRRTSSPLSKAQDSQRRDRSGDQGERDRGRELTRRRDLSGGGELA